jgi:hypothetical protein
MTIDYHKHVLSPFYILLLYTNSSTITLTFINNMSHRDNLHRKGACIRATHGSHKGKVGTIQKVNLVCHLVVYNNGAIGFVQQNYCILIKPTPSSAPRPSIDSIPDLSSMLSTDNSYVESCHGSEVTSQVLMDLLTNSIAVMQLDDTQVNEWVLQLHDQINHFHHGPN